jgi:conjugative transfer signal peptidase TraF
MLYKNILPFKITLGLCFIFLIVIFICTKKGLTINITASYPLGIYQNQKITNMVDSKNKLVLVCPDPNNLAIIAATENNILPIGSGCGTWGFAPLLKKLVGFPGDIITATPQGILINNNYLKNSEIKFKIFELLVKPGYKHTLKPSEYWVMSDYNPNSFDSRYIGPVEASQIIKETEPLITIKNNK